MKTIFHRTLITITLALLCSLPLLTAASAEWYFIQVGAYAQQQYVDEELDKLEKKGVKAASGRTVHGLTSVFFGDFPSRAAASKEAAGMKKGGQLEAYAIIPESELVKPPATFDQSGKRVDDSRTYLEFLPPSSERATPFGASLPGSVFMPRNQKTAVVAPAASPATPVTVATAVEPAKPAAPPVAAEGTGQKAAAAQAAPVIPAPKVVARMGDTMTGALFESGKDRLLPAAIKHLDQIVARLKGKQQIRIEVVGHTDNVRIAAKTRKIFANNQVLSEARAAAVARYLQKALEVPDAAVASSGKGESVPIADNRSEAGRARNRRTEIAIWYEDEQEPTAQQPKQQAAVAVPATPAPAAEPAKLPVPATAVAKPAVPTASVGPRIVPPVPPRGPCGAAGPSDINNLPFRITVDGQPVGKDNLMPEADRQRCVDVALDKNDIQVRFDPLEAKPALNTWSYPDGVVRGTAVEFGAYANYQAWIKNAEIRVFSGKRPSGKPLAVIPAKWDTMVSWTAPLNAPEEMVFLLRVYDRSGRFDETAPKPLRLLDKSRPHNDLEKAERERLIGWGQDSRALATIPVHGGTVTVNGKNIRPGQRVESLGTVVPVDKDGKFAVRQILPAGPHTVKVSVTDPDGSKATFSRNLTIADQDWFYVAIGDLTVGQNHTSGPAALVNADTKHYDAKTYVDGRGAFYLKGLIKGEYLLTAAADTGEQPVEDLFRNFSSKDPRYLLRRIDADRYYPVYGDDSTMVEDAPTYGKFYVRLERGDSQIMWGNFQTQWTGTELTQFSRALYGAQLKLKSTDITSFGEKKFDLSAFAAEPGTLQSRDEFRGTGGSLYYLRHLDITQGSENIWVEVRDKDSGLVLERKQLVPAQDYEMNYLQGRLLLTSPLSSVSGSGSWISTANLSGNPMYLVTTYEYVPGVTAVDGYSLGLQGRWWVGDYLRLGVTGFRQGENEQQQRLGGVDVMARYTQNTYIKAEIARSEGPGSGQQNSVDGGFAYSSSATVGDKADAKRVEAQVDLNDLAAGAQGKASVYWQDKDKGFSGPGQISASSEAERKQGGRITAPVVPGVDADVKVDDRQADSQTARSFEGTISWQMLPEWQLGLAARHDDRWTAVANASSILSENGERTDIQGRVHYKPLTVGKDGKPQPGNWDLYGFLQGTAEKTGNRSDNDRGGLGGGWQVTDRLRLNAEVSGGDGGMGGLLGGDYRVNDRSNVYLTYSMESQRPDTNARGRYSTAVTGTKYRISDEMAIYGETKATSGAGSESLVNAFGLDLSPNDRWTYGFKGEIGVVSDAVAGDLKRQVAGFSLGYKKDKIKYAGNLEYRHEDGSTSERHVWLVRNSLSYQVDKDWRWFQKVNFSISRNNRGAFYDGDFVELVTGAAYRPVMNDRLNALFKYTYFQDTPTAGQLTASSQVADYVQRSHVVAADAIYDLCKYLSVGGKVGYRYSQLKPSKTVGEWFDSHAVLGVARADFHLIRKWDIMGEYRTLAVTEAKDMRSGFLTAVYYHLHKNFKAGVGYNFTDFSDDMTDLSYRSHGWFFNVIGKF
ncbi:Flagellar motor protein [Trichlorobacter thiogenes]|uniref:Flagellar motor protein n=1 Tax=Trichlorobacter thiogenes TaxID=115783 RepID=A0A1T4M1E6_9BACT|nr:OmpA family protein [Trichlorobacter thiogenes]SJZ60598.1 Flagellar motor protein [Trichlorobacter thiogenes]